MKSQKKKIRENKVQPQATFQQSLPPSALKPMNIVVPKPTEWKQIEGKSTETWANPPTIQL